MMFNVKSIMSTQIFKLIRYVGKEAARRFIETFCYGGVGDHYIRATNSLRKEIF